MKKNKRTQIEKLLKQGMSASEITNRMEVSQSYVWKVRKEMKAADEVKPEVQEAEVEKLTGTDFADFVFQMSQGKGRTPPVDALLAERELTYGSFSGQAQIAQELKHVAYNLARDRGTTLIATQNEALDMIFHKIGRILNGNPDHVDNWIDIAGYAKLVADDLEKL